MITIERGTGTAVARGTGQVESGRGVAHRGAVTGFDPPGRVAVRRPATTSGEA